MRTPTHSNLIQTGPSSEFLYGHFYDIWNNEDSYVGSQEIQRYLSAVADKHKVRKHVKFNHQVTSATWNEVRGHWELEVTDISSSSNSERRSFARTCSILINASGFLNNWKWPDVPGLHEFNGSLMHSAQWKDNEELSGKSVAVIGAGSSGMQIIPALQSTVGKMIAFIRSPTWVAPSQGFVDMPGSDGQQNPLYTDAQKQAFRDDPAGFLEYRKQIESGLNRIFNIFLKDSAMQESARQSFGEVMRARLGDSVDLADQLVPKYAVGCRRLTPGQGFLEALTQSNVKVVTAEIDRVTTDGLMTVDGLLHKVDAIICATGFDTTWRPRFPIYGRDGASLAERWAAVENVEAYLGMAIPDFPNYLMFTGPNTPVSNGTLIPVIEKQAAYMTVMIRKYQRQRVKSFAPSNYVTKALNTRHQRWLQRTVWADECRSTFKGGNRQGKIVGPWPGSSLHYFEAISEVRFEDWEYGYWADVEKYGEIALGEGTWGYLGSGFTTREEFDRENGEAQDLAWYLVGPVEPLRVCS